MPAAFLLALAAVGPPQTALVVELSRPAAVLAHPLVAGVWDELADAPGVRDALSQQASDAALDPLRFVADRTGRDLPTLLGDLTAGGVRFKSAGVGGGPAALSVTAASPRIWADVLPAARTWLARTADPLTAAAVLPPQLESGEEWTPEGLRYRLDGATLRIAAAGAAFAPPADRSPDAPLLSVTADLDALRAAGPFPEKLGPPWGDANLGAFLGGYADSLNESRLLSLTLSDSPAGVGDSPGLSLSLQCDAAGGAVPGFFAAAGDAVPGPLEVPGAIYSAAWFRDYRTLWERRGELLTADRAAFLEAKDGEVRQGIKVLGADVLPSELFAQLGTSWRLVVAGPDGGEYAVAPDPPLPAVGLVVSLRDAAAFERLADPVLRGVRLVATFGGAKLQPFRDAGDGESPTLSGLRFADGPGTDRTGDLARFNAAPSWAVHRDHFVIASNRPVARSLLAALDAEAVDPRPLLPGVTEAQRFDPAAFAALLEAAADVVRQGLVFDAGFAPAEADRLAAALAAALRRLGPVTVATRVGDGSGGGLSITAEFTSPDAAR